LSCGCCLSQSSQIRSNRLDCLISSTDDNGSPTRLPGR
uniref:Uncharacterized protein n=1 Tax=Haemonchus placei TaxID=6290 RepID=A0A158QQV8_HAEPC